MSYKLDIAFLNQLIALYYIKVHPNQQSGQTLFNGDVSADLDVVIRSHGQLLNARPILSAREIIYAGHVTNSCRDVTDFSRPQKQRLFSVRFTLMIKSILLLSLTYYLGASKRVDMACLIFGTFRTFDTWNMYIYVSTLSK